jgi:hypothetical protein
MAQMRFLTLEFAVLATGGARVALFAFQNASAEVKAGLRIFFVLGLILTSMEAVRMSVETYDFLERKGVLAEGRAFIDRQEIAFKKWQEERLRQEAVRQQEEVRQQAEQAEAARRQQAEALRQQQAEARVRAEGMRIQEEARQRSAAFWKQVEEEMQQQAAAVWKHDEEVRRRAGGGPGSRWW